MPSINMLKRLFGNAGAGPLLRADILPAAGVGASGAVALATTAQAEAGTDNTTALTPRSGAEMFVRLLATQPSPGIPSGGVIMWSGAANKIPTGWALCNGENGAPDLVDRFILGAGGAVTPGTTGGSKKTGGTTLTVDQMPSHAHSYTAPGYSAQYGGGSTGGGYNGASGAATGTAGGSQPHDHDLVPPYYALCFIIKL